MRRYCILWIALATAALAAPAVTWHVRQDERPKHGSYKLVFPELRSDEAVHKAANRAVRRTAEQALADFMPSYRATERGPGPYELELSATLSLVRPELVSILVDAYSYTGGAHGSPYSVPLTFGMVNGEAKELDLSDIILTDLSTGEFAEEVLLPRLNAIKREREIDPVEELAPEQRSSFVLTPTAITWVWSPYEVGSYAEGYYTVKIPVEELRPYLRKDGPLEHWLWAQAASEHLDATRGN